MKIRIKYNLLHDTPGIIELENNDIDILCNQLRDIFIKTGEMVYAETENNVVWIQGPEPTVIVSERVKDECKMGLPQRESKKH